ncbi:PREDICTED: uncharacterized protein LOC109225688 [Nicotiana attenuata]|uniref:uncharacterized protein LOC109225688 n=1 Tax=Nicotiana attenuata TaxID=49451 RepID=UPI0009050F95|nr:PREDICTED: uncharacterized protein LOC109225688 [Nicotiana attenuata]XP_019245985.1 PREDICTED: uncharacterized protein LOC109225688 [Nicotiana attenuata]
MSIAQWQPLIEKMVARISSWTAKKLSYAGRIQLVQSVLFGIQAYWSQLFLIPSKVLKTIEAYCRSYIWSRVNTITRRSLVAWEKMCTPKSVGGLNLINLKLWNKAVAAKNYWDLANKEDKMWIKWIHAYYIKGQQISNMPIPQQASRLVRKIREARRSVTTIHIQQKQNSNMIRQLYLAMMGQLPRVEWKMFMYGNEARAKAKFTMWLYFHDRMLTSDRLSKWGIQVDKVCSLCQKQDESRNHLFIECEYTMNVWTKLLKWMQRQQLWATSWDQHWHWATKIARGKSREAGIFRMIYAEALHEIWNERNLRIFEKQSKKAEDLARNIACICNVRARNQNRQLIQNFQF